MGMCKAYGQPKQKHADKATARLHAHKLNKIRIHLSEAYKCTKCGFWHAGRIPPRMELKRIYRYKDSVEEAMVGKLIGALKNVINKPTQTNSKENKKED